MYKAFSNKFGDYRFTGTVNALESRWNKCIDVQAYQTIDPTNLVLRYKLFLR